MRTRKLIFMLFVSLVLFAILTIVSAVGLAAAWLIVSYIINPDQTALMLLSYAAHITTLWVDWLTYTTSTPEFQAEAASRMLALLFLILVTAIASIVFIVNSIVHAYRRANGLERMDGG